MHTLARTIFSLILLANFTNAMAQTSDQRSKPDKGGTGTITGRVTVSGRPAAFARVYLQGSNQESNPSRRTGVATDVEGRFTFTGLAADRYYLTSATSAHVSPRGSGARSAKVVTLEDGQSVDGVDLNLVPGAVITGRVANAQGHPLIGMTVYLTPVVEKGQQPAFQGSGAARKAQTDDRGVYRAFGLPAGRYTVSFGSEIFAEEGISGYYARTYHPGVTDPAEAGVVEVSLSDEATGIDITTAPRGKTYTASGRIVDEAGRGIPGGELLVASHFGHNAGLLLRNGHNTADSTGKFFIEGLAAGRYIVSVPNQSAGYGETVTFDITDGNVSGIEVKLKRGATVSGVVVVEGSDDPAVVAKLGELYPQASLRGNMSGAYVSPSAFRISPDGSFSLPGLKEGKLSFSLSWYDMKKNFSLQRVERNGSVVAGEITVLPGEQINNVRLVLSYNSGSIRGQVQVENGELPQGMRPMVHLRRLGQQGTPESKMVDERGRFVFDGLATGEYEVMTLTYTRPGRDMGGVGPKNLVEKVSVTNGSPSQVTLTINLPPR